MGIHLQEIIHYEWLLFADDQVIIALGDDDSSYTIRKLQGEYNKWLNTEYLVFGDTESGLELGNERTKQQSVRQK